MFQLDVRQDDVTLGMLVLAENLGDQETVATEEPEPVTAAVTPEVAPSRPRRPTSLRGRSSWSTLSSLGPRG